MLADFHSRAVASLRRCLPIALVAATATAQGDFVNFETPVNAGLAIARLSNGTVNNHDFLLAVNTDDNSVEIYDTWTNAFVRRVPVGLGPVTVRFLPPPPNVDIADRFVTVNYLGDSITLVDIVLEPNGSLTAVPTSTINVGDAPTDLTSAFGAFWVTMSSPGLIKAFDAITLAQIGGTIPIQFLGTNPQDRRAMKEPWRMAFSGTKSYTLNHRADTAFFLAARSGEVVTPHISDIAFRYSLDRFDWSNGSRLVVPPSLPTPATLPELGSANNSLAVASNGLVLIAGSIAHNNFHGEAALNTLSDGSVNARTGFVSSHLFAVEDTNGSLTMHPRDLNQDAAGQIVGLSDRVSMPTDIALMENGTTLQKVFVASFQTDCIVALAVPTAAPQNKDPATWPSSTIPIPTPIPSTNPNRNYRRSGPRSLVMKRAVTSGSDPGDRLYCLNRIDCSISVIDPNLSGSAAHILKIAMQVDPSPPTITNGRNFLYDATLSGGHMVACGSCHLDGRTDGLRWILGDISSTTGPQVPLSLQDGAVTISPSHPTSFWDNKGEMVTQSLQGLATQPVDPALNTGSQELFSNAPYHWRGDRADLTAFNGAFATLMGGSQIPAADMGLFRDFMNTIMYPPNPEQPIDRTYAPGSPAGRGLELFHTHANVGGGSGPGQCVGRSCVHCHALPSGTNSRITVGEPPFPNFQPMETPGLRGISIRESWDSNSLLTSSSGLIHTGFSRNILDHIQTNFPAPNLGVMTVQEQNDINAFVRAFDSGVAPIIGASTMIRSTGDLANLTLFEGQANQANAGLVLFHGRGTTVTARFFNVPTNNYVLPATGAGQSAASLFQPGDWMIAQATPVGSERRIASVNGHRVPLSGPAPAITVEKMIAPSQWASVQSFTGNAYPITTLFTIWPDVEAPTLTAFYNLQQKLIGAGLGLPAVDGFHEAPRRFRVSGNNIRPGARLRLVFPAPSNRILETDLFPMKNAGKLQWVSTLEVAPLMLYEMMCGGPDDLAVQEQLGYPYNPTLSLTPGQLYGWTVINEDNTASPTVLAPIMVQ